jgi:hypothetical protein
MYDTVDRGRTDNEGEAGTAKDCSPDKVHGKEHITKIMHAYTPTRPTCMHIGLSIRSTANIHTT